MVLFTNRKLHWVSMGTKISDLEWRNGCYFKADCIKLVDGSVCGRNVVQRIWLLAVYDL